MTMHPVTEWRHEMRLRGWTLGGYAHHYMERMPAADPEAIFAADQRELERRIQVHGDPEAPDAPRPVTLINVNRQVIDRNTKRGENFPPVRVKRGARIDYAHEVAIVLADGTEVARFVYRPEAPLACGARVWVETRADVKLEVRRG